MGSASAQRRALKDEGPLQNLTFDASTGVFVEAATPTKRFIKGPIPLDWMTHANALPGKAGAVGIALWFLAGVTKNPVFRATRKIEEIACCERKSVYAAFTALEAAGLIRLTPKRGSRPTIEIVELK
jgi:hypothetical protein